MSKSNRWILLCIGTLVFGSELVFGIWMAHWNQYIEYDAISRVANAFYVIYSRDPHLAAIGFIWNPLPSLMMLPLLLAKPWFPELASEGIAANILSAFFAAITVIALLRAFIKRGVSFFFSLLFALLFILNPFIFLYGSNGMSELIFIFFLVICVIAFTDWIDSNSTGAMIVLGFSLALSFLTRYESIFFGIALAVSFALIIWKSHRAERSLKTVYYKLEATEIIALLPAFYTGIIWIVLNWTIMGDGLYFLRSNYSNISLSESLKSNDIVAPAIGHLGTSLIYIAERSLPFIIPLVAVLFMRLIRKKVMQTDFFVLLLLILSIPAMQLMLLYKGASYGWLRFYVYPFAIIFAWLPYELGKMKDKSRFAYKISCLITVIILIFSGWSTWSVMNNKRLAVMEYETIHHKDSYTYESRQLSKQIAKDLDRRLSKAPHDTVLTDSYSAYQIILTMKRSKQLVITSDNDFHRSLKEPFKERINYILVPKPVGVEAINIVNATYKNLYEDGAPFAKLVKEYSQNEYNVHWRLFKVIDPKK